MKSKYSRRHVETPSVLEMRIWTPSSGLVDIRSLRRLVGSPSHPCPMPGLPLPVYSLDQVSRHCVLTATNSREEQRITPKNKILADTVQRYPPLLPPSTRADQSEWNLYPWQANQASQ